MKATYSLPFHSLSILLVGITVALVYTNFSITTRNGAAQKARHNPITSIMNDNGHAPVWDKHDLHPYGYVFLPEDRH